MPIVAGSTWMPSAIRPAQSRPSSQHCARQGPARDCRLAHCVEECVATVAPASTQRRAAFEPRVGMAEADDDARVGQMPDLRGGDRLGRDGAQQNRHVSPRGDQRRQIVRAHRPDELRVVRALSGDGQMRAFEMQPEKARDVLPGSLGSGGDGLGGDLGRIGDQRRQQRSRAERHMRPADRADGVDVAMVVQHDAAAAIDLQVDEAGRQHAAVQFHDRHAGRHGPSRNDLGDVSAFDDQRGVLAPNLAVEYRRPRKCPPRRHTVSVTLRRLRGSSGLKPRRRANASTNA